MHTSSRLASSDFSYRRRTADDLRSVDFDTLFPDYHPLDRIGVVSPCVEDGLHQAAAALLAITTTFDLSFPRKRESMYNQRRTQMRAIKADDLDQGVYDLFDRYVHGQIDRREFMDRVSKYAVAGLTASAIFNFLAPDYVNALQIDPQDARLHAEYVEYNSPKGAGTMRGLLARAANSQGKLPGIVVVHENRGLNPHIEDVARRAGLAGFIVLAPDALTPLGGYPGTDDEGRALQQQRNRDEMLEDFIAAHTYLKSHPECSGKVGAVGFCFGGWIVNMMAVRIPDLGAAVPFYGSQPSEADVPRIQAPLLIHYAGLDTRINDGWPAYEAALNAHKKEYTAHMYPDVNHGFHNDTTPRYDRPAAALAWKRTIDFFNEKLR